MVRRLIKYLLRCPVAGDCVSPDYLSRHEAEAAQGSSELLVMRQHSWAVPRDLPTGLAARRARATQPFDPYGFWRDHVSRKLEAYEYLYRTGSRALYDHYFRGLPKLADTED